MKAKAKAKKVAADVRDAAREFSHRVKAGTERAKRDIAGGSLTTGQKVRSGVSEAGHRVAAEVDRAKRKTRDRISKG